MRGGVRCRIYGGVVDVSALLLKGGGVVAFDLGFGKQGGFIAETGGI